MNWRTDNMRKTLFFVGVGLIASIIAAAYILRDKKKKYNDNRVSKEPEKAEKGKA